MNIFHEYLEDWEFDQRWRGFVERLAVLAEDPGAAGSVLQDCAIWPGFASGGRTHGMVLWVDVIGTAPGSDGVTLAGLVDDEGLRCGTVPGHCPDNLAGADLTWLSHPLDEQHSFGRLAELFADWIEVESRRPIGELVARRRPPGTGAVRGQGPGGGR
jgi:hypothetical protein